MRTIIVAPIMAWTIALNVSAQRVSVDPKTLDTEYTTHAPSLLILPDSLEDLVKKSDVVAHGMIKAVKMEAVRDSGNELPTIQTVYTVDVLDASKVAYGVGSELTMVTIGGSVKNGHLVPLETERQLKPGEKVLLFLRWWEAASAFLPTGGLRGIYETTSGRTKALRPYASPLRSQVEGKEYAVFVDELRRLSLK